MEAAANASKSLGLLRWLAKYETPPMTHPHRNGAKKNPPLIYLRLIHLIPSLLNSFFPEQ
jgi:hypothetical protein